MAIIAGDVKEIACDHSEFGSRIFEGKSGEDATINKGGFTSNDDDTNITALAQRIDVMNMKPWGFEHTVGGNQGDVDYLQDLSASTIEANWTVTFMDNSVRSGTGKPVGDIQENKQAGTIAIKIQGSGTLDLI